MTLPKLSRVSVGSPLMVGFAFLSIEVLRAVIEYLSGGLGDTGFLGAVFAPGSLFAILMFALLVFVAIATGINGEPAGATVYGFLMGAQAVGYRLVVHSIHYSSSPQYSDLLVYGVIGAVSALCLSVVTSRLVEELRPEVDSV